MSEDYRAMWQNLGLDLAAHDALLSVLGKAYVDIYMSQKNRPQGMAYFDFVMSEVHGLRIKELLDEKAAGRKIIGSYCVFVPEEIALAGNATLVGLCAGADFAVEEVHRFLPANTCALIKSSFGFKLGKVCPYLEASDMIVGENTCDGKKKAYEILGGLVKNLYVMDMPQMKSVEGRAVMKAEFVKFLKAVENLTGRPITVESLKAGIATVNAKRKALHRLAKLRAADLSPISGLDALLVNQVSFYDNPARFTESVNKICDELEQRIKDGTGVSQKGAARLILSGCPMAVPNWKVPAVVESLGAVIVGEELCTGERGVRNLVDDSADTVDGLIEALVDRYFQIDCAVFTPNPERVSHVEQMAKDYSADGVIHYSLQFCAPYLMESGGLAGKLATGKIPVLRLETDYAAEDMGQISTRVGAFLETIAR